MSGPNPLKRQSSRSNRSLSHIPRSVPLLGLVIALSSNVCAAVGLEDAEAALRRGDYASAVPIYQTLSDAGDGHAMVRLAGLYQKGEGVPKDLARAVALYTQAAAQKNADALYNLGNLYLLGEGVPQDDDWAFTYYREAAKQGHPLAQKNVNEFYRVAKIPIPSPNDAITTTPAASANAQTQNTRKAQPEIPAEYSADELNAIQIARAQGIMIDVDAAHHPPSPPLAIATTTQPEAQLGLTLDAVRANLANGDIEQALADLRILASNANAEAQFMLSDLLSTLRGNPDDQTEALLWLKRSAQAGYAEAQYKLGGHYLSGERVPSDEAEAVTWYRAAARQGHSGAREKLDEIYRQAGLTLPSS
jgi:uncharacterized protein